jgi:hypothetical protein
MPNTVLDIGAGPAGNRSTRVRDEVFRGWSIVRMDIDPRYKPDIVGSAAELKRLVPAGTFQAVWSSHTIEHLYAHEVPSAIGGVFHALAQDGFAVFTCPDLIKVARLIIASGLESTAYMSPAGPITPLDMVFGHRASIARGETYMGHRTGFTQERLTKLLLDSGFVEVWAAGGTAFDLWAVALMPKASSTQIANHLSRSQLRFLVENSPPE